jgi:hypothetical protein
MCEEKNGEDIVYIEAIMPSQYKMLPGVHINKEEFLIDGKYKFQHSLICREEYRQFRELQKKLLGLS